jgi:iron complex transport system substrate-binding protein
MYLGTHGGQLFGGTRGTSYHDVLVHGGLVDAAAERYEGWPALTSEQVLELDPELLVTAEGKADELCHIPGLERLRPCRGEGRIVEVPAAVLIDPGTPMLEAAEAVRRAVHGPPPDPEAMEATR